MISGIKRFFEEHLSLSEADSPQSSGSRVELATAALLFELLKTDSHIDERETQALRAVLKRTFTLDDAALDEIVALAEAETHQATSLYEFTSLINRDYDPQQKIELIANMWRLAFADHVLDKYEEGLIRRTADLIHVSHSDFIRSKLAVREELDRKTPQ